MKITAISSEHSDKTTIALVTEPPLTPPIFQEFEQRVGLPDLEAKLVSGCLAIQPETFTPELRQQLERLLTAAEAELNGAAARRQAELEQAETEKAITLESAAAGFGLPIV